MGHAHKGFQLTVDAFDGLKDDPQVEASAASSPAVELAPSGARSVQSRRRVVGRTAANVRRGVSRSHASSEPRPSRRPNGRTTTSRIGRGWGRSRCRPPRGSAAEAFKTRAAEEALHDEEPLPVPSDTLVCRRPQEPDFVAQVLPERDADAHQATSWPVWRTGRARLERRLSCQDAHIAPGDSPRSSAPVSVPGRGREEGKKKTETRASPASPPGLQVEIRCS